MIAPPVTATVRSQRSPSRRERRYLVARTGRGGAGAATPSASGAGAALPSGMAVCGSRMGGSLRHAGNKIPPTVRREADTIAVELRQRFLMLTQGTELPVMQRGPVFHSPDRIPLRCGTNILISGILLCQAEKPERFRHPAFQLSPDGTAAAPAGELPPGFREFAGQCLKMYRGDRLFRPPSGKLGPDRFRQVLPDAICCVSSLSRDRPLTLIKGRFAYFLAVVNFRKVVICRKVGSHRNSHPVI